MTRAIIILAVVVAYLLVVRLMQGPLRPYVPDCRNVVIGFCFDR
jgi:hypothetical protein